MLAELRARLAAFRRRYPARRYRLARAIGRRLGYDVVPANYYSPVPDLSRIPARVWTDPDPMPGLAWDLDRQLAFLETELGDLIGEHRPPEDPPGDETGFYLNNDFFPGLDAEVLHAIVRRFRPARVIELGAGFSTLVIASAAERNRGDGAPLRHEVFDPFPSPVLARVRERIELNAVPATDVPIERFAELAAGDLLFIDTTHTIRPAGDVLHLILRALPAVASGVMVHVHDFFRPFEYPRALYELFGAYWQEHHLLQGFLAFNPEYEILCANHALRRQRPDRVKALVPRLDDRAQPSSLWLRRAAVPAPDRAVG